MELEIKIKELSLHLLLCHIVSGENMPKCNITIKILSSFANCSKNLAWLR